MSLLIITQKGNCYQHKICYNIINSMRGGRSVQSKKTFRLDLLFCFSFFLLSIVLNQPVIENVYMRSVRAIAVTISLIISLSIWANSAISRCGGKQLTKLMSTEYAMMLFLLVVRCIKYETINYDFAMYLWYMSYIPIIFLPLIAFLSTITIENGAKIKKQYLLLYIPAVILSVGVLSNNLHGFAFDYGNNAPSVDNDYEHNFLFYIIVAWILVFLVAAIVNSCRKSHLNTRNTGRWLIVALIISVFGCLVYYDTGPFVLRKWFVGFYEAQCLLYALFFEICLDFGMLPTNDDHESILQNSTVWMLITDKTGNKKYSSNTKMNITEQNLIDARNGKTVLIDNSYELRHSHIHGGNVYFTSDVRAMIKLNDELEEVHEILVGEQEILDAEVKTREGLKKLEQQNLIYEKIDERLAGKNNQIKTLLDSMNKDNWQNILAKVSVVSAFFKRQGNLMILAEQNESISLNEFAFCFTESVHYINNLGISSLFSFSGEKAVSLSNALKIYELFEYIVERYWDNSTAILAQLSSKENGCELKIEIGCESVISLENVISEYDEVDETLYISAFFNEEVQE